MASKTTNVRGTIQVYDNKQYLVTKNGFLDALRDHVAQFQCGLVLRETSCDIDKAAPLLVLCHNWSRIGTDVDGATRELMADEDFPLKTVAVIVVHEKDEHALPVTSSSDVLYDEKYDKFGLIVDFAYTAKRHIYNCSLNVNGRRILGEFIKKHVKMKEVIEPKKSVVQIYCQHRCERAKAVYGELDELIKQDKDLELESDTIDSMLDWDREHVLVAIVEDASPTFDEFVQSAKVKKNKDPVFLLVLRDSEGEPEVDDKNEPVRVYVSKNTLTRDLIPHISKWGKKKGGNSSRLEWASRKFSSAKERLFKSK